MVDHVVVIEPAAEQKTPFAGLPLVLDHAAEDVYLLIRAHVVADRHVVDVVVAVLHAERQFGGEKQQPFEPLQELRAADDRQSVGAAVGFAGVFELFVGRAFACAAVVTLARGLLHGRVDAQVARTVVAREEVEGHRRAVDVVIGLLGDVGFVRRQVEPVSAAAELVDAVVFERQLRVVARAQVGAHAEHLIAQVGQFGVAVAVVVVARTVAVLPVDVDARLAVVAYQRGVDRRVVVVGAAASHGHERMADLGPVAQRLLGDDVDRAADGRRAEERRSAAADHLHALDHVGGNLFETVDAVEGREERPRVEQDLRIVAVQTVDAYLREAAVLTSVLDAHARLETQTVGQRGGVCPFEQLAVENVDQRRRLLADDRVAVDLDHHFADVDGLLFQFEIQFRGGVGAERDAPFGGFVADRLRHDGERSSYRQVAQQVVARDVGRGADRRSLDGDGDEGEVFAAAAVDDVADQDGFGLLFGSGVCICRKAAEQQAQQQNI